MPTSELEDVYHEIVFVIELKVIKEESYQAIVGVTFIEYTISA